MLGSTAVKSHINQGKVIDLRPRIIGEWNMNSTSGPYMYGTYNHPESFPSRSLSADGPSPEPTTVNRGESNAIFSDTQCQLISISGETSSASVAARAVLNGVVTLVCRKDHNIKPGQMIKVSGVGDFDGIFIAGSGTNGILVSYDINDPTVNRTLAAVRPAGSVSSNFASYYMNFSVADIPTKAVKFFMKLKSDYQHQLVNNPLSNPLETFQVKITVTGYRDGKPLYTQVSTKNYDVDSSQWTQVSMAFANPDEEIPPTSIRLELSMESVVDSSKYLLVDQIAVFPISEYEVYSQDRLPLSEVFEPQRPGEILMDYGPINVDLSKTETFAKQSSPVHMASAYALGPYFERVQRSIAPFAKNPYSYYVSGSDSGSKKFWCLYEKESSINRIVIKSNAIATKPKVNKFKIKVLTASGWQEINTANIEFNNNGILNIYYKSGAWSTTQWANNVVPKINLSTGQFTDSIKIKGIYLEVQEQVYVIADSLLNKDPAIEVFELVEISPRLEIDLSDFVTSFNVNKELEGSNIPLPIGRITSNSANITFTSIPITVNNADTASAENDDVFPLSNYSANSPFKDLMTKGIKFKGHFDLDLQNRTSGPLADKIKIPAFVMYSERWSEQTDRITVECFDIIKKLQSTPSRPIYLDGKNLNEIVYSILDSVGFGDYLPNELLSMESIKYKGKSILSKPTVRYYWGRKEESVVDALNELFKAYQVSMFVDEYGILRFTSLLDFSIRIKDVNPANVVYVQDMSDSNSASNLISSQIQDVERPEKILLRYKTPSPSVSDYRSDRKNRAISFVRKATDIVWEPEQEAKVLTFFELSPPGIVSSTQDRIAFNVQRASTLQNSIEYSGYLLIDQEIVRYDGIEFIFTIEGNSEYSKVVVIRDKSDIERTISEIFQDEKTYRVNWTSTGYMVNVERGLFGTVAKPHPIILTGQRVGWNGREFNRNYKEVSTIDQSDGKFGALNGGVSIQSNKTSGGIFIFPSENNTVDTKRRFFCRYEINSIPSGKNGYLGAAIGVQLESQEVKNGLFVFTGVKSKNKQSTITMKIDQVVNGEIKTILAEKDFDFSDDLFDQNESIEMYIDFNSNMDQMSVVIGSTSIFQKVKDKKDPKTGKTIQFKTETVSLKARIQKKGIFGFAALESGKGLLDAMSFTAKSDAGALNNLAINNLDDSYNKKFYSKAASYFTGNDTLLDSIIYNQYIAGFNVTKDSFVFTGAPVARGLEIFEVDYQDYPIVEDAEVEFLGYSYNIDAAQSSNQLNGSEGVK